MRSFLFRFIFAAKLMRIFAEGVALMDTPGVKRPPCVKGRKPFVLLRAGSSLPAGAPPFYNAMEAGA